MGLKEQLRDTIPGEALSYLSDRFDIIGEIAVLSLPEELNSYRCADCGGDYLPAAWNKDGPE